MFLTFVLIILIYYMVFICILAILDKSCQIEYLLFHDTFYVLPWTTGWLVYMQIFGKTYVMYTFI